MHGIHNRLPCLHLLARPDSRGVRYSIAIPQMSHLQQRLHAIMLRGLRYTLEQCLRPRWLQRSRIHHCWSSESSTGLHTAGEHCRKILILWEVLRQSYRCRKYSCGLLLQRHGYKSEGWCSFNASLCLIPQARSDVCAYMTSIHSFLFRSRTFAPQKEIIWITDSFKNNALI